MKWNYKLSLTMLACFAIILPITAFAKDQNQDEKKQDKKEAGDQPHGGKSKHQPADRAATSSGDNSHGHAKNVQHEATVKAESGGQRHATHAVEQSATVRQYRVPQVTSESVQSNNHAVYSRQRNQTEFYSGNQNHFSSNQQQYNRSNNYGGLWFPENSHRDWDRNGNHYWNRHHYRWYEGGWLIIDGGFRPNYSNTRYSRNDSIERSVQMTLADQGYYRGPIDGDIGPGSRNAIANYQDDYGLRVTGRINDQLLQSLRL